MNPHSFGKATTVSVRRVVLATRATAPLTQRQIVACSHAARNFSTAVGHPQPAPNFDVPLMTMSSKNEFLSSTNGPSGNGNNHKTNMSNSGITETSDKQSGQNGSGSLPPSPPPRTPLPPVNHLIQNVHRASKYNQGNTRYVKSKRRARREHFWDVGFCRETAEAYEKYLVRLAENPKFLSQEERTALLATGVVDRAFRVILKCQWKPNRLSKVVRHWERALGKIGETTLSESFSLRLVEANGKAGNIGRVMSLLDYRTQQKYPPCQKEFVYAITAVEAAGWYLRSNRNVYLSDHDQPVIDNPTRWLDAILLNMSQRNFPLTKHLAARMLDTYTSRGRTGKAMHYFYSVHRTPRALFDSNDDDDDVYFSSNEEDLMNVDDDDESPSEADSEDNQPNSPVRPFRVRLKLKPPPPYYKIPTEVDGKLISLPPPKAKSDNRKETYRPKHNKGVLKIDRESEPDWSLPLTAAFSFADSLTHGACGHEPIQLDLVCYNILIKACVYRGALWRAMNVIDTVMPSAGIKPNSRSYDSLLSGLARVGDVTMMRDYYQRMNSQGIEPSYYTVQCIVDGLLNLGDVAGVITVIQDFFNQHSVLPPVKTHLKVLEFALGLDMIYEAKRHVYFIQQLWKWEPNYKYESKDFIYLMKTYQQDRRISKEALQHLFAYFGETLDESDFF